MAFVRDDKFFNSAVSGAAGLSSAAAKSWDDDEEEREKQRKAEEQAKKAEESKRKKEEQENKDFNILRELTDIAGTTGKHLAKFGADVFNDVTTGFDRKEARKRTDQFLKDTGIENWDAQKSYTGDLVGGVLGGIPSAVYDSARDTAELGYDVVTSQAQSNAAAAAAKQLDRWTRDPEGMEKATGENREEARKQLLDVIKKNQDTEAQRNIQNTNPREAAKKAAETFINAATLGAGSAVANTGQKIAADALLAGGQTGLEVAGGGEVDPTELGVNIGLSALGHIRGARKEAKAKKAELDTVAEENLSAKKQHPREVEIQDELKKLEAGDPKYLAENSLLDTEGAEKRYKELTSENPEAIREIAEAAKSVDEAQKQIDYYNDLKQKDPYFRQADKIEAKRGAELEQLDKVASDPQLREELAGGGEFDEAGYAADVKNLEDQINAKYDAEKQALAEKYPESAAQEPAMNQALEEVTNAKLDAQDSIEQITNKYHEAALKEANAIRSQPSAEKVAKHIENLQAEANKLSGDIEKAKVRAEEPNKSVSDVDKEIESIQNGTHPLSMDGTPKEIREKLNSLQDEREKQINKKAKQIAEDNPNTKVPDDMKPRVIQDVAEDLQLPTKTINQAAQMFQTPNRTLRKIGLDKLADKIETSFNEYRTDLNASTKHLQELHNETKLSKASQERVVRALEGEYIPDMTKGESIAYKGLRKMFNEYADKLGLKENQRITDYFPHMFENKGLNQSIDKVNTEIKALKQEMKTLEGKDLAEAQKKLETKSEQLQDLLKQRTIPAGLEGIISSKSKVREKSGNIDFSRLVGADDFIKDPFRVADAYVRQAERKIHMSPAFDEMNKYIGNADVDTKVAGYIQRYAKSLRGDTLAGDKAINSFTDSIINQIPGVDVRDSATKGVSYVKNAAYRANLQMNLGSALKNLSQGINTYAQLGGRYTTIGYTKLMRELKNPNKSDLFKEMGDMHIFDDSFRHEGDINIARKTLQKIDKIGWAMFDTTEKINRGSAYIGAREKYLAKHPHDIEGAKRYAQDIVRRTQFTFNEMDTPPILRSKIFSGLAQYQSFNIKQAEMLTDMFGGAGKELKRKLTKGDISIKEMENTIKALRWAGANAVVAATVGSAIGYNFEDGFPNPLDPRNFQSPLMQLFFGGKNKDGIAQIATGQSNKDYYRYYDDEGKEVSQEEYKKAPNNYKKEKITDANEIRARALENFVKGTLPGIAIPWYTQYNKTSQAVKDMNRGYAENQSGNISYLVKDRNPAEAAWTAVRGRSAMDEYKDFYSKDGKPLSNKGSEAVKDAPEEKRQMYYDFFKAADQVTGRGAANTKITELYRSGRPEAARRKAQEFNDSVTEKMAGVFSKYNLDDDLKERLEKNLYINITARGEKSRARRK